MEADDGDEEREVRREAAYQAIEAAHVAVQQECRRLDGLVGELEGDRKRLEEHLKGEIQAKWAFEHEGRLAELRLNRDMEELGSRQEAKKLHEDLHRAQESLKASALIAAQQASRLQVASRSTATLEGRVAELEMTLHEREMHVGILSAESMALKERLATVNSRLEEATAPQPPRRGLSSELAKLQEELKEAQGHSAHELQAWYAQRVRRLEAELRDSLMGRETEHEHWEEQARVYRREVEVAKESKMLAEEGTKEWMERCSGLEALVKDLTAKLEASVAAPSEPSEPMEDRTDVEPEVEIPSGLLQVDKSMMEAVQKGCLDNNELFARYVEAVDAYNKEHELRTQGSRCLQHLFDKLEQKSESIAALEHRVQLATSTSKQTEKAYLALEQEKQVLVERLEEEKDLLRFEKNKQTVQAHSAEDLSLQVRTLLQEVERLKAHSASALPGLTPSSTASLYGQRGPDKRRDAISKSFVAVHDLEEMQQQNRHLRDALRAVALEAEQNQVRLVDSHKQERVRDAEQWAAEMDRLKADVASTATKLAEVTQQRDFYFLAASEGRVPTQGQNADAGSSGTQTLPGARQEHIEKLNAEVAQLKSELAKAKDAQALVAASRDAVKQMQHRLAQSQSESGKVRAKLETSTLELGRLDFEHKALIRECETAKERISIQRRLVNELIKSACTAEEKTEEATAIVQGLTSTVSTLEHENAMLKTTESKCMAELKNVMDSQKQLLSKVLDAELRCNSLREELDGVNCKYAVLLAESSGFEKPLAQALGHLNVYAERIAEETGKLKMDLSEKDASVKAMKEAQEKVATSEARVSELEGLLAKKGSEAADECTERHQPSASHLEAELETTREALRVAKDTAEQAEQSVNRCKAQMESTERQAREAQAESTKSLEAKDAMLTRLQDELHSARREIERLQIDVQGFEEQTQHVDDLQKHIAKLESEMSLNDSQQTRHQLETQVTSLRNELASTQASLEEAKMASSRYQEELQRAQEEALAAVNARKQYESALGNLPGSGPQDAKAEDDWPGVVDFLRKEKDKAIEQLAAVEDELSVKKVALEQSEKEVADLRMRLQQQADLGVQMALTQEEHAKTVQELKQLSELSAQTVTLRQELVSMRKNYDEVQEQKGAVEAEAATLQGKVGDLQAMVLSQADSLSSMSKQVEAKDAGMQKLQAQVSDLQSAAMQLSQLQKKYLSMTEEVQAMRQGLQREQGGRQELQTSLAQKTAEVESLQKELNAVKATVRDLQARKPELQTSSVRADAVPAGAPKITVPDTKNVSQGMSSLQARQAMAGRMGLQAARPPFSRKRSIGEVTPVGRSSLGSFPSGSSEEGSFGRRSSSGSHEHTKRVAAQFREKALDRIRLQGGVKFRTSGSQEGVEGLPDRSHGLGGGVGSWPGSVEGTASPQPKRVVASTPFMPAASGDGAQASDRFTDGGEYSPFDREYGIEPGRDQEEMGASGQDFSTDQDEGSASEPEQEGQGRERSRGRHNPIKWQPTPRLPRYRGRGGRGRGPPKGE
eukprot:evm.model.scf_1213.2 EVM.evm.TU.scf_1213.2   scf_1213:13303-18473(+)